jgi:hypothetical protein
VEGFAPPPDAPAAAWLIQTALPRTEWPELGPSGDPVRPRVRMGLHSGEAWPSAGGYATPEVHRTARICSAAHGDQVLGSAQFAAAAGLDADQIERLGDFELRGLPGTTELVQLAVPGMERRFPPPPIQPRRHNLPAEIKRPVDRADEYAELDQAMRRHRLVTLTGLAGCGKTTTALGWARRRLGLHSGGVWYCAAGTDLAASLVDALGCPRELLREPVETAIERLRHREALLVLDDVARGHARTVDRLLRECPGVTVLATGLRPLELAGEAKLPLGPPRLDVAAELLADFSADRRHGAAPADCRGLAAAVDGFLPALRALADLAALAGPSTAMRHLIADPMRTLDGGGRFRAAVDEASAALSAPARAILNELAAHSEGATVDRVIELCRQCDANLEALVELVDTALVMVERPGGEAVYRVPAPLQWLLAPHTARVRRQPLPTLANAVRLDPGLVRVS